MSLIIIILTIITLIYVLLIAWVSFGFYRLTKTQKTIESLSHSIKISIIIPLRNEAKNIANCLTSLELQNYNKDYFEVIIVNDHSTDYSISIVEEYIKGSKLTIKLIHLTDTYSKKEGLKFGIESAQFDVIATIDADCIAPKNWLNLIASKIESKSDMILGPVIFFEESSLINNFQQLDLLALQGIQWGCMHYGQPILNNAANLAFLKKSYKGVGGFDDFNTPSGDDVFLLHKFKKNQLKIDHIIHKEGIIETASEKTVISFLNQRIRWASKSKYYSNGLLILFSVLGLVMNISLIFIYLGVVLVEKYTFLLLILLICKWLIDFILLLLVASFFKRKNVLFYFIPVQIIYPIYIALIWFVSMLGSYEWKGRKYNG